MADIVDWDGHAIWLSGDPSDGIPGDDGALLLTGWHGDGSRWFVDKIDGWWGGAGSSISPTQRGRLPGAFGGNRNLQPLSVTLEGRVQCVSREQARYLMDQLKIRSVLYNRALTVQEDPDLSARWRQLVRSGPPVIDYETSTQLTYSFSLTALDPRMFGDLVVAQLGGITPGGTQVGIHLDDVAVEAAADLTWHRGATFENWNVYGGLQMTNEGNYDGPLIIQASGPINGLRIVLMRTGRTLGLDDLVLAEGQVVTIDCENELVLRNDGASLASTVTNRGWTPFRPGVQKYGIWTKTGDPSARSLVKLIGTPGWY